MKISVIAIGLSLFRLALNVLDRSPNLENRLSRTECNLAKGDPFQNWGVGYGGVGSGDWAFCIVTLAALDLETGLDACSRQRPDRTSIDMVHSKEQSGLN